MKRKGFTLIELLAVIVILAIIATIAIPTLLKVVEKSKKSAAETSALGYIDAIEKQIMVNITEGNPSMNDGLYDIPLDSKYAVKVKGDKPTEGWFLIEKNRVVNYSFKIRNYYVNPKDGDVNKPVATKDGAIATKPIPISFETDSWSTIIKAVRENNTSAYHVGDTKDVDLGKYGVHKVRIANMSNPSECATEGFSQTACGFVLEFTDVIAVPEMSRPGSNSGGWPASGMRSFTNSTIYDLLPEDLKPGIADTYVVSGYGSGQSSNYVSTDKLYFLSVKELWGVADHDTAASLSRQLDYYASAGSSSNHSVAYKSCSGYSYKSWWYLRTAGGYNGTRVFIDVDHNGWWNRYATYGSSVIGISPAFKIG